MKISSIYTSNKTSFFLSHFSPSRTYTLCIIPSIYLQYCSSATQVVSFFPHPAEALWFVIIVTPLYISLLPCPFFLTYFSWNFFYMEVHSKYSCNLLQALNLMLLWLIYVCVCGSLLFNPEWYHWIHCVLSILLLMDI